LFPTCKNKTLTHLHLRFRALGGGWTPLEGWAQESAVQIDRKLSEGWMEKAVALFGWVRVGATGMTYFLSQRQHHKNVSDQAEAFDFRIPDKVC